jgi:hypothetical protein
MDSMSIIVLANQEFSHILWASKVCYSRIAQIFQKSGSSLTFLTWNKSHPDYQQILWATLQNSVSKATLSPEFLHSCLNCIYKIPTLCPGLQIFVHSDVISLMTKSILIQSLDTFCVKMMTVISVLPPKWLTNIILYCMSRRTPLVPVISFGEPDVYDQVQNPEGSWLRRAQEFCRRVTGIAPVALLGRGLFQYSFGVVPQRRPITTLGNVSVTWIRGARSLRKHSAQRSVSVLQYQLYLRRSVPSTMISRYWTRSLVFFFSIGTEQVGRSGFHLTRVPVNKNI